MRRATSALLVILLGCIMASGACDDNPAGPNERTITGDERTLAGGTVRSWVTIDRSGTPTAFGLTFTETVLSGLPDGMAGVVLGLPAEAAVPPFDHMTFDWMPGGHPPPGIYTVPHFDVHAYLISEGDRDAITPADPSFGAKLARAPEPASVPAGYVPSPGGVPRMGAHWIDPSAPEFNGQPFTSSLQYGFYDGRMVFLEPMLARSFLETKAGVQLPITQPQAYPEPGFYPTSLALRYDPERREYTIAFEGLVGR